MPVQRRSFTIGEFLGSTWAQEQAALGAPDRIAATAPAPWMATPGMRQLQVGRQDAWVGMNNGDPYSALAMLSRRRHRELSVALAEQGGSSLPPGGLTNAERDQILRSHGLPTVAELARMRSRRPEDNDDGVDGIDGAGE